jgi:hypothetical protein
MAALKSGSRSARAIAALREAACATAPSVSSYTKPAVNTDGSIEILFGPEAPKDKANWIQTVPGKGWFPIFRFYSPTETFFDKTWKLEDIQAVR